MHLSDDLIFVHVPRTGGSSVRYVLADAKDFEKWRWAKTKLPVGLGVHSFARDIRDVIGTTAWRQAWTFATVRNPYRRLLSLYLMASEWGNDKNLSRLAKGVRTHDKAVKKELEADRMRAAIRADRRKTFKVWLDWCDDVQWNPWRQFWNDPRPITRFLQIEWLTDHGGKIIVDEVAPIEDVSSVAGLTFGGKNVSPCLPRTNASRSVDDWRSYFDRDTIAWTRRTFAGDFERLGYSLDV